MSLVLNEEDGIHARKSYQCSLCAEEITRGSLYDKRVGVDSGDMWTMRMHPECHAYERSGAVEPDWYDGSFDPAFSREDAIKFYQQNQPTQ